MIMNTFNTRISKTISKVVLATSLLLSVSTLAAEQLDVKALTAFMVEQNTQQVNQQLAQQLNNDIQFSVMMKLPTLINKESGVETLLAKTVINNESKNKNQVNGE